MMCEINVFLKKREMKGKKVALTKVDIKEICGHKEQSDNVKGNRQELFCTMVA